MFDRSPLFLGPIAHEPHGPSALGRRVPVLFAAFALCAGLFGGATAMQRSCARHAAALKAQKQERAQADARMRLLAERSRLAGLLAAQEQALDEGRGCHMAWVKYQLELLQVEEQLACTPVEHARIRQQITDLTDYRNRMSAYHHGRRHYWP